LYISQTTIGDAKETKRPNLQYIRMLGRTLVEAPNVF